MESTLKTKFVHRLFDCIQVPHNMSPELWYNVKISDKQVVCNNIRKYIF